MWWEDFCIPYDSRQDEAAGFVCSRLLFLYKHGHRLYLHTHTHTGCFQAYFVLLEAYVVFRCGRMLALSPALRCGRMLALSPALRCGRMLALSPALRCGRMLPLVLSLQCGPFGRRSETPPILLCGSQDCSGGTCVCTCCTCVMLVTVVILTIPREGAVQYCLQGKSQSLHAIHYARLTPPCDDSYVPAPCSLQIYIFLHDNPSAKLAELNGPAEYESKSMTPPKFICPLVESGSRVIY